MSEINNTAGRPGACGAPGAAPLTAEASAGGPAADGRLVSTSCGQVRGTSCQWEGVTAFKGIRYAVAGRWEYPELVEHWDGIYEAVSYGNCSYQPRAFYNEEEVPEKAFYYNEFRKGETYTYDDDCLFLNIWKPEEAAEGDDLPVIFYIHGGGYTGGCGHEKHFDGPIWPEKGVIAVTCNYRLGPMGFMCLPQLAEEAGHTGNYGLFDQVAALKWVNKNIKAFGGNPDNVTIMGQSAGAMSVQQLVLSPLTDGLFAKAVMNSGGGVSKLMNSKATSKDRYEFWEKVMAETGCSDLNSLRALPAADLFAAWQKVKKETKGSAMKASPCIDGLLITGPNYETAMAGKQKQIPYMMGSTSHDMAPPIIHSMAASWCKHQAACGASAAAPAGASGAGPTAQQPAAQPAAYCWHLERMLPGDNNGSWHSSDLWYFFGTLANCWRPFTEKDYALSDEMTTALCNFAKTGNPNGPGLPAWNPATAKDCPVMIFGDKPTRQSKPNKLKLFWTMLTNKAVGE